MRVEWLVGFYMLVCLSMIVFNVVFVVHARLDVRRVERRGRRLSRELKSLVEEGHAPSLDLPRRRLDRVLGRLSGLEALDRMLSGVATRDPELYGQFLALITPALERLARRYEEGSPLRRAYFSYIVSRWYMKRPADVRVTRALLGIARTESLFARQGAFSALAHVGSVRDLVEAASALEVSGVFHHPRLVTETLLAFPGDREELAGELARRFEEFRPAMQAAIIDFGRLASLDHLTAQASADSRVWLKGILESPATHPEVRIACVRYFGRYPWEGVADSLRKLAERDEADSWECAAVAALALGRYPGPETVAVLRRCLSSNIWYVRHNAAQSLCDLGLELDDLRDVLEGDDRFARDAIVYRWEEDRGGQAGVARNAGERGERP